ncbi:MAG: hypothetical protein Q8K70_00845 [Bacteroidota bacterium]|nr:hypothetical protein [Bacteroidota bacterium]
MKNLFLFLSCICSFYAFGQEVNKEYKKLVLNEQFETTDKWNTTFNSDNLFLGQNGFYELYRRSKKSGYFILPDLNEEYGSFQVETQLIFGNHNNKKQSAGLLLMAKSETSGGILVEINQKKEFRIVRVYKDKQVAINASGSGWRKASNTITKGENTIIVKTYNKVYDLYINNVYMTSFTDIELNKGKIGLYIGPDSKVKFDLLKIYIEDKVELKDLDNSDIKEEEKAFTQIIIKLKDQLLRKDKELDDLKTKLKMCENNSTGVGTRFNDTATINTKNRLQIKVTNLEDELDEVRFKIVRLEEENKKLKEFKTGIEKGEENGDIIINLTNMVSNQKKSIDILDKQNKVLNDENNSLFKELKDMTKTLDKTTNDLTSSKIKNLEQKNEIDSLMRQISQLKDSISKVNQLNSTKNDHDIIKPGKPKTEEELLQEMIEKEREERRKRLEEEERKRKELEGQ